MKSKALILLAFFFLAACSDNSDTYSFKNVSEELSTELKNNSDPELRKILQKLSLYQLNQIEYSAICPSKAPNDEYAIYTPEAKRKFWNECVLDTSSDNYDPRTLKLYENFGVHYVGEIIEGLPSGYGVLQSLPDATEPCIYFHRTVFGNLTHEVAQYRIKEDETSKQLNTCQSFKYYGKFDNRAKNVIVKTKSDLDKVHGFRSGSFLEGVLEITYLNGQKEKFEGTFFNTSLRSEGILYYSNGDTFQGRFVRNTPFFGTYTTSSYIYKGQLDGNYPKGRGIIIYQDGTIIDCSLKCAFWPNKNSKQENNLNYKTVSNQEYIRLTKEDDESKYVIPSYKSELAPCPKQGKWDNCFGEQDYTKTKGKGIHEETIQSGTYIGEWKDNKRHGYGVLKDENCKLFNMNNSYMKKFLVKEIPHDNIKGIKKYNCKSLLYKGNWIDNFPHGLGEASITYSDGTKKRDEYVKENGIVKKVRLDEIIEVEKYVGFWSFGSRILGKHYFANGNTFEGYYKNNEEVEGVSTSSDSNGIEYINYYGEWDGRQRKGMGYEFSENGTIVFEGIWTNNKELKGKKYYENGDSYNGEFQDWGMGYALYNNQRWGSGELIKNNSDMYSGEWMEDLPWGRGIIQLNDGTIINCMQDCYFWPNNNTKLTDLANYPRISNEEYQSRVYSEKPTTKCENLVNAVDLYERQIAEGYGTLENLNRAKKSLRECIKTFD